MTRSPAAPSWKLQRSRRPAGFYFQLVWGPDRTTYALGYLTEEEEVLARGRLAGLPGPASLVARWEDPEGGRPLAPSSRSAIANAARRWLLALGGEGVDEVIAEIGVSEASRLEARGEYESMALKDFHSRVFWPTRSKEIQRPEKEKWWWTRHLLPELGHVPLKALTGVRWHQFLASRTTLSGRSKKIVENVYRACLRFAVELGALPAMHGFRPIVGSKKITRPSIPLTLEEVGKLLDAAGSPVHRGLFGVAIGLGLRPAEACALRWQDWNWDDGTVWISGTKTTGAAARIPITVLARTEAEAYWVKIGKPTEGSCWVYKKKVIREFKHSLANAGERAGLAHHVNPYALRHTFACLCAVGGVPLAAAKKVMRHSADSKILESAYQNLRAEQVVEGIAHFPALAVAPIPKAAIKGKAPKSTKKATSRAKG